MNVLIACEYSARVRDAFRRRGHNAWSCDLLPCDGDPRYHFQRDVRAMLDPVWGWDLLIAHPTCTRLTNSGVRWLSNPPPGRTLREVWAELIAACEFYRLFQECKIPKKAIENPVMHRYARALIHPRKMVQVVQPWWFGEPEFKATGFELHGLPPLVATNKLTPPKSGTPEHDAWSIVHRESPGPLRWKNRSTTRLGVAEALAEQWG